MDGKVTIDLNLDILYELSIHKLSVIIWGLEASQQAELFNRLGEVSQHKLDLQFLTTAELCNHKGRNFMKTIGECNETVAATEQSN